MDELNVKSFLVRFISKSCRSSTSGRFGSGNLFRHLETAPKPFAVCMFVYKLTVYCEKKVRMWHGFIFDFVKEVISVFQIAVMKC